jgi:hypothetical protein
MPCGGETQVFPAAPPPCTIGGREYEWKFVESAGDVLDLGKEIGLKDYSVAYALAEVQSTDAASIMAAFGSDDALKVWLNGKPVHNNWALRALTRDQDLAPLRLQPGRNLLLLKIHNSTGDWALSARALGSTGIGQALWSASKEGDLERIQIILTQGQGAPINARSKYGLTAWQIARVYGRSDAADLLVAKGADTRLPIPDPERLVDAMMSELVSAQ